MRKNIDLGGSCFDRGHGAYTRLGRVLPHHMTIYHQGDPALEVYAVNSGVVMVSRLLETCERQISGFYTQGDFFGLSTGQTHQDTAITLTTSSVTHYKMGDVMRDTELQHRLLTVTSAQLEDAHNRIAFLTRKTAAEKVAYFLASLAERLQLRGESFDLPIPMSRQDMADYLGLSIETVSRQLTAFKSQGLIGCPNRKTIQINTLSGLRQCAGKV